MALNPFNRFRRRGKVSLNVRIKAGGNRALAKPLQYGGMKVVPPFPRYWRNILPTLLRPGRGGFKEGPALPLSKERERGPLPPVMDHLSPVHMDERRLNGCLLVLAAKNIPHRLQPGRSGTRLYVPPLYEDAALHEICAFENEKPEKTFTVPDRAHAGWILLIFLFLFVFHGLRFHWFTFSLPVSSFPGDPQEWSKRFGLDIASVRFQDQWWRSVTALTLHADTAHLLGNIVFGSFFLLPLSRRSGAGLCLVLVLLAGTAGNIMNALFKPYLAVSIGFSTALFGGLGALCAFSALDAWSFHGQSGGKKAAPSSWKKILVFGAAGLALLGFLGGGDGQRTDYAAHIWGFAAGSLIGLPAFWLDGKIRTLPKKAEWLCQITLAATGCLLVAGAWAYALR